MNTRLYVDDLPTTAKETGLIDLFSAYGNVVDVNIVVDRTGRRPRRCGFVTMVTGEGARAAIQGLNGKSMGTDTLTVRQGWPGAVRANAPNERRPSL